MPPGRRRRRRRGSERELRGRSTTLPSDASASFLSAKPVAITVSADLVGELRVDDGAEDDWRLFRDRPLGRSGRLLDLVIARSAPPVK